MDLRRLRLFLAVVDHGGFTAGARAAHVAQPAVSLAVRELETEVGATLLVRSRRGARLTPAGEALVAPARQALRDIDNAAAAVAAVTGLVAGRLDVASLPSLAADPLPAMVGRFRHAHPAVAVRLTAPTDPAALADDVRSGTVEIGLTEAGVSIAGLHEVPVDDQELVAVLPPGTRWSGGRLPPAMSVGALAGQPLVLTEPGSSLRSAVDRVLAEHEGPAFVAVETAQRDALVPLVLAGAGATVLPAGLADEAAAAGAVVRRFDPPLRRRVVLVHRQGAVSPAAAAFLTLAGALP